MRRRLPILAILILLGAGVAFWAFDLQTRLGFGQAHPEMLTLYGNVDIRQVELGFRVPGRIAAMGPEEGDRVAPGAVLASLDPRPYQDDLHLARAGVARQAANLAKLEAGTRPGEIAQARALVAEREAVLANAQRVFERQERLIRTGATTQQALDDARALKDEAEARLVSVQRALDLALDGFRQEDIAAARAALDSARAGQAAAETTLSDAELQAPAGGVVLSRVREPGAIVAPGETVYTLSLEAPVWVRAYVPEPSLGLIHPGMRAEILTDSRPEAPYHGQIGFISPVAEFTPRSVETPELRSDLVYRLRVVVEDADQGLRQGMPVTVRLPDNRTQE